jgi:large subunit ribosomal protein L47
MSGKMTLRLATLSMQSAAAAATASPQGGRRHLFTSATAAAARVGGGGATCSVGTTTRRLTVAVVAPPNNGFYTTPSSWMWKTASSTTTTLGRSQQHQQQQQQQQQRQLHTTRTVHMPLDEFRDVATRQERATQMVGRPWSVTELRRKSFDDLHKLWLVLYKERNMLLTEQQLSRRRQGLIFPQPERMKKVQQGLAAIRHVLGERKRLKIAATTHLQQQQRQQQQAQEGEGEIQQQQQKE